MRYQNQKPNSLEKAEKMIFLFLALLLVRPTSAYLSLHRHRNIALSRCAMSQQINEVFLTSIFGRLTDNYLLLDIEGAGTPEMMNCCHSGMLTHTRDLTHSLILTQGCDNCDYARIFDNLTSGKPKWIPLYAYRKLIDGRDHLPLWTQLFEANSELTRDEFIAKIKQMPYSSCIGPPNR